MQPLLHFTRRVIGPAVFFALAALLSAAEPERLTFCSYNLKNWLTMEQFGREISKSEAERAHVVQILAAIHPDILGVCEIGTDEDLADLQQRLLQAGVDLPHTELAHGGDDTRRLACSRACPSRRAIPRPPSPISSAHRRCPSSVAILDVTISITPTFDLHLLGVHLKSMREITEADQAQMRRNEARLLRLHIDSIFAREPGARILAYGDFNEHRNAPAVAEVMGSPRGGDTTLLDVLLRDENGEVWTHFWDAADTYSRLDYCFTSRLLRPHLDTRRCYIYSARDVNKASDHRPLVIKLSPEPIIKR